MRVIQLLPTLTAGDAVSNDARALQRLLRRWDAKTEIYAENIGATLPDGAVKRAARMPALGKDDVLIYHMSIGSDLSMKVDELCCRKIMIYHNITPPEFFEPYNEGAALSCRTGLAELHRLRHSFDYCIADSDFNRRCLVEAGYTCPIDVCPVLIPFSDYDAPADEYTLKQYGDGRTNILFVGRIAPNKCQQDVIAAFAAYQRLYDAEARLILAGGSGGMESYERQLRRYVRGLGARHVTFTGHIPFAELLAYYRTASAFLCMSEHEGFCVPLLEAMHFGVPVAAFDAAAVGETLGEGGILLRDKNRESCARVLHDMIGSGELVQRGKTRLADFAPEKVERCFTAFFESFLKTKPLHRQRVLQVVPVMNRGDAVSNDITALRSAFESLGCAESVWTLDCADPMMRSSLRCADTPPLLEKDDLAVYHMGMGCHMVEDFLALRCRKAFVYHNITPSAYFESWNGAIAAGCRMGRKQTRQLVKDCELAVADSAYNAAELRDMGAEDVQVLPILIPFSDYDMPPCEHTLKKYGDGCTNVLFVGRVVPNKKFEDVIRAFALYQRRFDAEARLILAGGEDTVPAYARRLRVWAKALGARNVVFTGKIPFSELLALYRTASVFLCLSEHEGFCVPLLEAMYFDVPVVARRCAAVGETLGRSGLQLDSAESAAAAAAIRVLVSRPEVREQVLAEQRRRLADFSHRRVMERAREIFGEVCHG
ncbi:MAG: glycosyltransferase [Ruminococcaceae bacterium]|nr:glycosyltransferase [Oscillospiraceae bacterium]